MLKCRLESKKLFYCTNRKDDETEEYIPLYRARSGVRQIATWDEFRNKPGMTVLSEWAMLIYLS